MATFSPENSIKSEDKDELIRKLIERVSNLETKYSELEDKVETLLEKVFFLHFDPQIDRYKINSGLCRILLPKMTLNNALNMLKN